MLAPILYSFRRCPYAIRARMALRYAGINYELREVQLKNKPADMLALSEKGTVPVLVLGTNQVIDESRDVMHWALQQNDPDQWYYGLSPSVQTQIDNLIEQNDTAFKPWLDKYKYAVGHPEHSQEYYREKGCEFLSLLDQRLNKNTLLVSNSLSMADIAIFPFIRQFAFVDKAWFDSSGFNNLQVWLTQLLATELFAAVMEKHPVWQHDTNTRGE